MMKKAGFEQEPKVSGQKPTRDSGTGESFPAAKSAWSGSPIDGDKIGGAVKELERQHPHDHMDIRPHHEDRGHLRHEPLHGMRPSKR